MEKGQRQDRSADGEAIRTALIRRATEGRMGRPLTPRDIGQLFGDQGISFVANLRTALRKVGIQYDDDTPIDF